jgi:hypothetical protein
LNELFNDALRTSEVILAFEERYKDIGTKLRCYLELFLGGGSYENPQENEVGGICFRARLCHEHKMSATTNNFFFMKKDWTEKARNVQNNV